MLVPASAATVSWNGGAGSADWMDGENWDTGSVPTAGDTINISGSSVNWNRTAGSLFGGASTVFNLTNGATVTLGNTIATSTPPNQNPRFDGQFNVGGGCTLNVNSMFVYGTSRIDGTVNIYNLLAPGANNSMSFGLNGVINFMRGSKNGVEGNNRTTTISASLNTGTVTVTSVYGLEKRYLMVGAEGGNFSTNLYQGWRLTAGRMTGSDGSELTSFEGGDMTASAENFGKYQLGSDKGGVYVQYVGVVPEPATASLSLLGLSVLMMRRRRS